MGCWRRLGIGGQAKAKPKAAEAGGQPRTLQKRFESPSPMEVVSGPANLHTRGQSGLLQELLGERRETHSLILPSKYTV